MAYQPTTNYGWAMPRGGDQAQISVINQQFTAKADEIVYQTRRMIAPGYIDDGSKTYHEGEIVEYENVDYVCTGTTSGAWDSSKWDATDMATQIQEAKESGGTNVVANPSAPATEDLSKLQVENTVYGIPDPTVTKTATGNPIEFTDGADAPLVKCVTQITGYQSGSGTPSPDNIRPITAYTEGEISIVSHNLWDEEWEPGGLAGGTGLPYNTNDRIRSKNFRPCYPNTSDYGYIGTTGVSLYIWYYASDYSFISNADITNKAFTTPSNAAFFKITTYGGNYTTYQSDIAVNYPSTVTAYEPYKGTTHTTTFPTAIYRGGEDCVKGEVTCERLMVDLGSLSWNYDSENARFYTLSLRDYIKRGSSGWNSDLICSCYAGAVGVSEDGTISEYLSTGYVYVKDTRYDNVSDFRTAVTGQTLAYELATPTTTPVTPTNLPIKSLSGYNHIESSTGDMEVEYITQTYQPLVDLIDEAAEQREAYSTDEQEIGTWVDGSKLYQKTYTFSGTGAANPFSTTVDMTGKTITNVIPHYAKYTYNGGTVGYCVGSRLTANNSNVLTVQYNDDTPPTLDVIANLGGSTETYEVCFTLQYTKTSSNNRSLSKGAADSLKADLSEEKKEIEESVDKVDKVDKVDEPTETIEEKEENAGESNSENER